MSVELIHTSDNVLTEPERRALEQHEEIIERGIQTFMEVGHRLQEIRDARLYREQYSTFEAYCKERWGWTRQYASLLIKASDTAARLSTMVDMPAPNSERQVRPLTKLKTTEEQYEAWCKANEIAEEEDAPLTGKIVQQAVDEVSNVHEIKRFTPEPEQVITSKAFRFSQEAINCLGKIRPDDPRRGEALQSVIDWINHNR